MTVKIESLIEDYRKAKLKAEQAKKLEEDLEDAILKACFEDRSFGTKNKELEGFKVKAVFGKKYDFTSLDELENALQLIEKLPNGSQIAEELIRWKPELSMSGLKNLDAKATGIIQKVLVTKAKKPTLEIIEK